MNFLDDWVKAKKEYWRQSDMIPDTNDEVLEELKDIKTNIAALRLQVGRYEGATTQLRGTLHMFTGLVFVTILAGAIISVAYTVAVAGTCP